MSEGKFNCPQCKGQCGFEDVRCSANGRFDICLKCAYKEGIQDKLFRCPACGVYINEHPIIRCLSCYRPHHKNCLGIKYGSAICMECVAKQEKKG